MSTFCTGAILITLWKRSSRRSPKHWTKRPRLTSASRGCCRPKESSRASGNHGVLLGPCLSPLAGRVVVMIAIIDYGMGNLRSVQKAFAAVGEDAVVTRRPEIIDRASHLVLPGVGAFPDCMANLG